MTRARTFAALFALALAACGGGEPVAFSVAGVDFTESELLGLPEARQENLQELTALAAIVADDEVERLIEPWIDSARVARLWEHVQAEARVDSAGVTDAALEARYATAPDFELTVRHLIVFSERYEPPEVRAEAQAKARAALDRIVAGEDFGTVAAEVSDEPGAESREGLLSPGREGAWVDEFWAAASALEPGAISGVTETQYGYHVLRLEARDTVPFEEARADVVLETARLMGALDTPQPPAEEVEARAAAAGITESPESFARLRAQWVVDVLAQAEALGIPQQFGRDRVKEVAWSALTASGQNAGLARRAVGEWRDELARIHPLPERGSETGSGAGP
jgi:hypothetical protein